MPKRVSAVVIDDDKILLIKRVKPDKVYYTFPGGGIEEKENEKHAMWRELKEELSVDAKVGKLLFEIENQGRKESYFLIDEWLGVPELGGPEKERMNKENQYHLEWVELPDIQNLNNLYPQEAVEKLEKIYGK
ncbi:MAG: NUDIX domain-containing protein [Patescibacteria group bacterium]